MNESESLSSSLGLADVREENSLCSGYASEGSGLLSVETRSVLPSIANRRANEFDVSITLWANSSV